MELQMEREREVDSSSNVEMLSVKINGEVEKEEDLKGFSNENVTSDSENRSPNISNSDNGDDTKNNNSNNNNHVISAPEEGDYKERELSEVDIGQSDSSSEMANGYGEARDKEQQQLSEKIRETKVSSPSDSEMVKSKTINNDGKEQQSEKIGEMIVKEIDRQQSDSSPSESEMVKSKSEKINVGEQTGIIQPHAELPKPEAPSGIAKSQSLSDMNSYSSTIGKYIRERSNSFSAVIAKTIYSLKENIDKDAWAETGIKSDEEVTQFNLSGLKVIVTVKNDEQVEEDGEMKGRISLFSRSNCRDCTAVRTFFREKGLRFVEINIDVYPSREKELVQRTGSSQVPQIFLNEKLFGGLVALNSLRNSGTFNQRFREMLGTKCSSDAPAPPVYGFDDHDQEESLDGMLGVVKVLRQRLPIQDRLMKMKIVKNCFSGSEMVELLINILDCGRKKAVEIGRQLSKRHFIHHVFGDNEFEDANNHFYRFLEHEPYVLKCYNFRGTTNDSEPKSAALVGERLHKIMCAILESYASNDRCRVDYMSISRSEEFRRYVNLAQDLQRVNLFALSPDEKLAFFLNLYNAMVIHAVIRVGHPEGIIDRKSFFSDFQYVVGGYPFSISTIGNGILRNNRRGPYSLVKPFASGDKRLQLCATKVNPLIHFGVCKGTRSSPGVRFFTPQGVEAELRCAAREFFQRGGMQVNLENRTVYLSRIIKWFDVDFGQEKEVLKWIINYLDSTKAGLLTHLMADGGPINVVYQQYDWSVNS